MVHVYFKYFTRFLLVSVIAAIMWNFNAKPETLFGLYPNFYKILKILFLPLLGLNWYLETPVVDKHIPFFIFAQWIGDIILLKPGIFYTATGGYFFAFGHIAMVHFYKIELRKVPIISYIILTPPIIFLSWCIFPHMKWNLPSNVGCFLYCVVLLISASASAMRLCKYPFFSKTFILCWIGYLLFIASDYFLILREFNLTTGMKRIETMLTYCLAQIMIVIGTTYAYLDLPKEHSN